MSEPKSKGDEYFAKAEGKVNKMFFKDIEGGYENFVKAGAQYRLDKLYHQAGEAYMRAGDCAVKLKNQADAATSYTDAANCFKKVDMTKAGQMLKLAIDIQIDNNRLGSAARLEKEFAEALETDGATEEAIKHYNKAYDYFIAEEQPQAAMACKVKVAKIYGELDKFDKCIELYQDIGSTYAGGPLRHQAKEFFVRALLCRLALVTNENRSEKCSEAAEAFESYLLTDVNLKHTRESEFCEKVIQAVDDSDVEKFEEAVQELNEMKLLDEWKTHVLYVIKQNFDNLC